MAKVLVIFFSDDEDADSVRESLEQTPTRTVVGVHKYPTKFCHCALGSEGWRESAQGVKYGWWIHAGTPQKPGCGLALRQAHRLRNLLDERVRPPWEEIAHHLDVHPENVNLCEQVQS